MTTEPTNTSIIPAWIISWEKFIKAHEKLILIVAASLVLWHFANKVDVFFDNKHLAAQAATNQQIAVQEEQNKNLQTQLAQMQASFDETVKSLNAKIDAKKQAVIVQQQKDAKMPPVELSARWSELIEAPAGSITPEADGTVIGVSVDAAHTTVNELEKIPQLTDQVADIQTELKACTDTSGQKDKVIDGLKSDVALEKQGRIDDAKVANDKQKKSFWKGTKFGSILTTVGIVVIKVATKL